MWVQTVAASVPSTRYRHLFLTLAVPSAKPRALFPLPGLPSPTGPTLRPPTHTVTNARAACRVPLSSGSVLPPSAQTPQGSPSPSSGTTPQFILQIFKEAPPGWLSPHSSHSVLLSSLFSLLSLPHCTISLRNHTCLGAAPNPLPTTADTT